jgi:hypothetical protein
MRKLILFLMLLSPALLQAQVTVGVKAGLNLANVTSKSVNTNMYAGYFIGGYIAPKQKKVVAKWILTTCFCLNCWC